MKIWYNAETGEKTGFTTFGETPEPFVEAEISIEEYDNIKEIQGGELVYKTQAELDAETAAALAESERSARAEITAYRAEILAKGMPYGDGQYIQADTLSRLNLKDIIENIDLMPFPYSWKTWDNTDLILSNAADMTAMSVSLSGWINTTFQGSFTAEAELSAAETAEAMAAIVEQYKADNPL